MKIDPYMNTHTVQEMMGSEASFEDALVMIDFLMVGDYTDTNQIGENEWLELCSFAHEANAPRN